MLLRGTPAAGRLCFSAARRPAETPPGCAGRPVRVLWVKPGDRGEQFAADITGQRRQMFVAKASGQVVAYGRILQLAAEEAGPGMPAGYYLSGVLVDPAWRGRGIATALTVARLRWAFTRTDTVFYPSWANLRIAAGIGVVGQRRGSGTFLVNWPTKSPWPGWTGSGGVPAQAYPPG